VSAILRLARGIPAAGRAPQRTTLGQATRTAVQAEREPRSQKARNIKVPASTLEDAARRRGGVTLEGRQLNPTGNAWDVHRIPDPAIEVARHQFGDQEAARTRAVACARSCARSDHRWRGDARAGQRAVRRAAGRASRLPRFARRSFVATCVEAQVDRALSLRPGSKPCRTGCAHWRGSRILGLGDLRLLSSVETLGGPSRIVL
jgi:hypothetical protein